MPISPVEGVGLPANLDMTLREWIERYQREIVFERVNYRGVLAWKNVLDLWVYQEIIWETGVEVVIEIGSRHGGTTLWLSDLLRSFRGEAATVISIDLDGRDVRGDGGSRPRRSPGTPVVVPYR